jgi:hypothetical protein
MPSRESLAISRNINGSLLGCDFSYEISFDVQFVGIRVKFYDDYGHRAKLASENKNVDWKAISHALRAAIQTKEILTTGSAHPCNRLIGDGESIKSLPKGKIVTQKSDGIEKGQGVFLKTRKVEISEPFAVVQQGR